MPLLSGYPLAPNQTPTFVNNTGGFDHMLDQVLGVPNPPEKFATETLAKKDNRNTYIMYGLSAMAIYYMYKRVK